MMDVDAILHGDALSTLRTLPDNSVHCCVSSPPYYGLRDYQTATWEGGDAACVHRVGNQVRDHKAPLAIASGVRPGVDASRCLDCGAVRIDQQIGLEGSVEEYVARLVEVFAEVRRVLRNDGTLWLNLGDSYAADRSYQVRDNKHVDVGNHMGMRVPTGLKTKDLIGVPWRVAFALQAAGWWLRSDIIWAKRNCMPESVTDRPTRSHEYIFLLAKSERYYYDAAAIAEPIVKGAAGSTFTTGKTGINGMGRVSLVERQETMVRNKRTIWSVATQPYGGAHFATFPPKLIEPCILAGCPGKVCEHCGAPWERITDRGAFDRRGDRLYGGTLGHNPSGTVPGSNTRGMPHRSVQSEYWHPTCKCANNIGSSSGVVLDPFFGSGTVGEVAIRHSRHYLGIELNAAYIQLAEERLGKGIQRVLWSAS